MILNINFEGSGVFDKPLNKEVNGLINRCLGENNKSLNVLNERQDTYEEEID